MEPAVNGHHAAHAGPSDQQVFDRLKYEVLESHRQVLAKTLLPDRHMDFLRSKHVLSEEDCDEISHPPTRQKRASKLLDILEKKGGDAYDALCSSLLEEGTQTFLLRQLHEDFERRQRLYRDLMGQQRYFDVQPPPLQPPPPPSYQQHHQGQGPQPSENVYPGYLPQSPSDSSFSCLGSSSTAADKSLSLDSPTFSTNWNSASMTTDLSVDEGSKTVDLQKERLNVAAYLRSLTIRQDESASTAAATLSPQPGSTDLPSDSSLERQLPTFLSSAATFGSSSNSSSDFSLDQAASSAAVPVADQDSPRSAATGNHSVQRRQHQRLSSRGSLQAMGIPVAGSNADPLPLPVPVTQGSEPVENEDSSSEDSTPESSGFFRSLDNDSLSPSSSGVVLNDPPILCSTAVNDQQQALGRCLCSQNDGKKDGKENINIADESVNCKTTLTGNTEPSCQLTGRSLCDHTDRKTVLESCQHPESSQPCDVKESFPSSVADQDGSGKEGEVSKEGGLVFEEGISRETRGSVCSKSGRSQHSSQC